jgi:hypothetical protein
MTPYYPARDGHPSMFESEVNATTADIAPFLPSTRIFCGVLRSPRTIRTLRALRLSALRWSVATGRAGHV